MKHLLLLTLSFVLVSIPFQSFGQAKLRLDPKEVRKMSKANIQTKEGVIPNSYLYSVRRNTLTLMKNPMNKATNERMFITKDLDLDQIEYAVIFNKKVKAKRMIFGGIVGGISGYFIARAIQPAAHRQVNIEIIGQAPEPNFFEPMVAAGFGIGIGLALAEWMYPVKIDMQKDRRDAVKKLRQFSFR